MRFKGTLVQWNEDRGFGFIEAASTRERLFVHLSAFERGGVRPPLGAALEFGIERDAQGRKRAVRVQVPGDTRVAPSAAAQVRSASGRPRPRPARKPAWAVIVLLFVVIAAGTRHAWSPGGGHAPGAAGPELRAPVAEPASGPWRCDGRTHCSQMTSCAEATWFLKNCQGVQMDGNHDGVPCEQQWCGSH